jgi:hypothetical protein
MFTDETFRHAHTDGTECYGPVYRSAARIIRPAKIGPLCEITDHAEITGALCLHRSCETIATDRFGPYA